MLEIRQFTAEDGDSYLAVLESVAAEGGWIGGEAPVDPRWAGHAVEMFVDRADAVMFLAVVDRDPIR